MAEMDVTELKHEYVQALVDTGLGKLHIKKYCTTCWCGRQWSQSVSDECPEVECGKCLRTLASSWAGGDVVLDP